MLYVPGIFEYSGVALSSALDQANAATGNNNALVNSGIAAAFDPNELIVGMFGFNGSGTNFTVGGGFTQEYRNLNSALDLQAGAGDLIAPVGSYSATATPNANNNWSALIATFKPQTY